MKFQQSLTNCFTQCITLPTSAPKFNMADAKRNRQTNWSKNETSLLKTLFTENESVLSAKLSNTVTNSKKKEVWEAITNEINLLGVAHRSISEVKTKWSNVARGLKSDFSTYRKEITKTGGGPHPNPLQARMRDSYPLCQSRHSWRP